MLEASRGKGNDEYVWPEEAALFLKALEPQNDTASLPFAHEDESEIELFFTVSDEGRVLELVHMGADSTSVRRSGEWVDISCEDEFPTVYEQTMLAANADSIWAWDTKLEHSPEPVIDDLTDYVV